MEKSMMWQCVSSATAEDLPTASFAGQHETYLNNLRRQTSFGSPLEILCFFIYGPRYFL